MTRKPIGFHRDMLAYFAKLMMMKKPPDPEAFKIRLPVDPFSSEDGKGREAGQKSEIKKFEEDH